jgi:hypothetical protein
MYKPELEKRKAELYNYANSTPDNIQYSKKMH